MAAAQKAEAKPQYINPMNYSLLKKKQLNKQIKPKKTFLFGLLHA